MGEILTICSHNLAEALKFVFERYKSIVCLSVHPKETRIWELKKWCREIFSSFAQRSYMYPDIPLRWFNISWRYSLYTWLVTEMYSNFAGAGAGGVSVSSEQLAGVRGMGTGSPRGRGQPGLSNEFNWVRVNWECLTCKSRHDTMNTHLLNKQTSD